MSCRTNFLNLIPPVILLLIVLSCYYSYVVDFCILFLASNVKKVVYLIVFHILFAMYHWAWLQAMMRCHPPVPEEYHLTSDEHEKLLKYKESDANLILTKIARVRSLELRTCTDTGKVRYCRWCLNIKPDRTHHCSTCGICILKMDHHCPWIYNCVGFANYKEFLLVLFYGSLLTIFYLGTVMQYVVILWKDIVNNNHMQKLHILFGTIFSAVTGAFCLALLLYHMGLISKNDTTLETLRDVHYVSNVTFNMGCRNNFLEVFGDNVILWFLPIRSQKGNGYEFNVTRQ